ncbi:MAG: NTP transferase domain-containing protein [Deltaproteobacteria bacterium]|nr:NTP transferase domain-containing protein [Deltaproteobacteria bacterium]
MQNREIAAIVLAAGYASRMGRLKPLLPLGGGTVVRHSEPAV